MTIVTHQLQRGGVGNRPALHEPSLGRWVEIVVIGTVVGAVWWWALRPRIAAAVASPLNHRTTS